MEDIKSIPALISGIMTHYNLITVLGVVICYFLYYTGIDYFWLKGIGVALIFRLVVYGIMLRVNVVG